MAQVLDGKIVAQKIKQEIKDKIDACGSRPGLAVCLVGADAPSKIYVTNKRKACDEVGIYSDLQEFDSNVSLNGSEIPPAVI